MGNGATKRRFGINEVDEPGPYFAVLSNDDLAVFREWSLEYVKHQIPKEVIDGMLFREVVKWAEDNQQLEYQGELLFESIKRKYKVPDDCNIRVFALTGTVHVIACEEMN